ncbi:hypothetical protein H2200_013329 [Cladophialophora chaetospira]|uniref:Zn(2)-C6 fungal-type domain-containing protein n=1 Tax=Cladophialophora chaetospira TaxID=386627 RepID=A0AA39CBA8_9EURO|nr:hypothetical protein H2200_013329 [Cladophialophora chaetospira]
MRVSQITGRRTNSLGWAKSDCHTCTSLGRHCDRRRPRCSPCLAEGAVCKGYVQQLNWERASQRNRKHRSKEYSQIAAVETARLGDTTASLPKPDKFTFVDHAETQKRQRRRSRTQSKSSDTSWSQLSPVAVVSIDPECSDDLISPVSSSPSWSASSPHTPSSVIGTQEIELRLSPQISHHAGDIESSLSFFHSRFAYTTLTFDVNVNPWRACLPAIHEDLPCVRYAAVALAQRQRAHFSGKPEGPNTLHLKAKALSLFASHLKHLSFEGGLSTSLLLIALDYAETGISNWTIHLRGAFHILESAGGIRLAESRPNLRSQIAMLIWYDVTAALISRYGPVFPESYIQALMAWQADEEWSILGLNGMPDGMFLDMHKLAVQAAAGDKTDLTVVYAIQGRILNADINRGDKYQIMMSQVWQLGLLLYCSRVFPCSFPIHAAASKKLEEENVALGSEGSQQSLLDPHELGLQILEMASQIPSHSNYQKQCLMPIILAGCEMSAADKTHRKIAIDYSERWKQKTGIWIFDSGMEFLRGVWACNDVGEDAEDVVDVKWKTWTRVFVPKPGHGFLFG